MTANHAPTAPRSDDPEQGQASPATPLLSVPTPSPKACERCGQARCGHDCRFLTKIRTNQTCAGCKRRILVGEYVRIRAAAGRGHYEMMHPACSRALYPNG